MFYWNPLCVFNKKEIKFNLQPEGWVNSDRIIMFEWTNPSAFNCDSLCFPRWIVPFRHIPLVLHLPSIPWTLDYVYSLNKPVNPSKSWLDSVVPQRDLWKGNDGEVITVGVIIIIWTLDPWGPSESLQRSQLDALTRRDTVCLLPALWLYL